MTDKWPRGRGMHRSTMDGLAGSYACNAYLRMRNVLSGRVHSTYEAMTGNVWECGGHTASNCYRTCRYGTDTSYASVREYTGLEPSKSGQMLQNIPVGNRHTVIKCYRIHRYSTDIP